MEDNRIVVQQILMQLNPLSERVQWEGFTSDQLAAILLNDIKKLIKDMKKEEEID